MTSAQEWLAGEITKFPGELDRFQVALAEAAATNADDATRTDELRASHRELVEQHVRWWYCPPPPMTRDEELAGYDYLVTSGYEMRFTRDDLARELDQIDQISAVAQAHQCRPDWHFQIARWTLASTSYDAHAKALAAADLSDCETCWAALVEHLVYRYVSGRLHNEDLQDIIAEAEQVVLQGLDLRQKLDETERAATQ